MGAVAIAREASFVDVDRVENGRADVPRVPEESERSRLERLVLRYVRWSMDHPQSGFPRFILKVSLIGYRMGFWRIDDDMTVTTTGRKSGLPRRAVLSVHRVDDRWYTLNPFGERAHWYRNILADPVVTIQRHGRIWTARATRLTDRDEALAFYESLRTASLTDVRWLLRIHGFPETAEGFADNIESLYFVRWDEVDEPGPPPMPADLVWIWPVAIGAGLLSGVRHRSIRRALGVTIAATVALVTGVLGWSAIYSRIEAHGTHPEGRWARLFAWLGPRATWWLYDAFDEALDLQPDDDVLDVACGCGAFLRTHATQVHSLAGIDHSVTLIDIAREQNRERVDAGTAEFVVGDVTDLPWEDGTFSVVTSNDVGCYEAKAEPAIEEMYRVLRSGGRAILADDRHEQMEAAGFAEVTVEPILRFGRITRGVKP